MSLDTAKALNLKGHPALLGQSTIANGDEKHDFLCEATFSVLGVSIPLVVLVNGNQPHLFCLDAILGLNMRLELYSGRFYMPSSLQPPVNLFSFLSMDKLLSANDLSRSDLIPVSDLPPITDVVNKYRATGRSNFAVNVGTSFRLCRRYPTVNVVNLGTAF